MPKTLFLARHAEAIPAAMDRPDTDRALTPHGHKEAAYLAEQLLDSDQPITALLCSPALRTRQTATLVAKLLGFAEGHIEALPALYNASAAALMDIIQHLPDHHQRVLIIGHNPGVTSVAATLSENEIDFLPTAAVAAFHFDTDTWGQASAANSALDFFDRPK